MEMHVLGPCPHKLRVLYLLINLVPFVRLLFTKLQLFDMTLSLPAMAVKGEGATAGVRKLLWAPSGGLIRQIVLATWHLIGMFQLMLELNS